MPRQPLSIGARWDHSPAYWRRSAGMHCIWEASGEKLMQISLQGKRAVVTGGSRGIGRSIALAFARAGAAVSVCARGEAALDRVTKEILAHGVKAHAGVCDLASQDAIASYVAAAASSLGGIDILVNNASGFGASDDEAGWAKSIDIDIMATVRASHAAAPLIAKAGGGAI